MLYRASCNITYLVVTIQHPKNRACIFESVREVVSQTFDDFVYVAADLWSSELNMVQRVRIENIAHQNRQRMRISFTLYD